MKKHGIEIIKHKKYQTKKIWNNGHLMATYRYQPFEIHFKNKMINDTNQDYCGGWFLNGLSYSNETLLQRVLGGLKPMAVFHFQDADEDMDERSDLLQMVDNKKFDINIKFYPEKAFHLHQLIVAAKGRMEKLFDLKTLQKDYAINGIKINIDIAKHKKLTDYSEDWDCQDKHSTIGAWETGLLLGYPIENTISLYKEDCTLNKERAANFYSN